MVEQIVRCVGLVIALIFGSLTTVARLQLGDNWSVRPRAKELVTTGLYSKIRNPMYMFNFCMFVGVWMVLQWKYFWVFMIALACVQFVRIGLETEALLQKFGSRYVEYRRQTWF